jgi:hypothetical protein
MPSGARRITQRSRGYGETMANTASLVSVTDGVSWKRIRTLAVVVAGPGTFHRYHPVSSAWVAIVIQVVPLSVA